MPQVHSHKVRLVGVDGQEQPVIFDIESEGVHLLNQKSQVSLWCSRPDPVRDKVILIRLGLLFCSTSRGSLLRSLLSGCRPLCVHRTLAVLTALTSSSRLPRVPGNSE